MQWLYADRVSGLSARVIRFSNLRISNRQQNLKPLNLNLNLNLDLNLNGQPYSGMDKLRTSNKT